MQARERHTRAVEAMNNYLRMCASIFCTSCNSNVTVRCMIKAEETHMRADKALKNELRMDACTFVHIVYSQSKSCVLRPHETNMRAVKAINNCTPTRSRCFMHLMSRHFAHQCNQTWHTSAIKLGTPVRSNLEHKYDHAMIVALRDC